MINKSKTSILIYIFMYNKLNNKQVNDYNEKEVTKRAPVNIIINLILKFSNCTKINRKKNIKKGNPYDWLVEWMDGQ